MNKIGKKPEMQRKINCLLFLGDVLVGFGSNSYDFVSPQDVQLTISYPVSGPGAIVTNVEIEVKQVS